MSTFEVLSSENCYLLYTLRNLKKVIKVVRYETVILPHDLFFDTDVVLSVQPPGTGCTDETLYLRSTLHTLVLQLVAVLQLLAVPL